MTSVKGWLASDPTGHRRMTAEQIRRVRASVEAVLDHAVDKHGFETDLVALVRRVIRDALDCYPPDASCFTCDYDQAGFCVHWSQEVPKDAREIGCEKHQTHGAPF